jgi:hypothetical protein
MTLSRIKRNGQVRTVALTISYEAAFMSAFMQGKLIPADGWTQITVVVLVADGGASDTYLDEQECRRL